jgi:thiamine-monophosphate kinase
MRFVAEQGCADMAADGTLGEVGEFGLIDRLTDGLEMSKQVLVGPGDDTALVIAPDGRVLVTVDILVEGRHFRRDWSTPVDIGRKAAAASLADIAAMGGTATSLVVALAAPPDLPAAWAIQCMSGLVEEAAQVGASVVGGDVSASEAIVISVTALGDLGDAKPVLRSGAKAGDRLALAGRVGWSAAGLAVLSRGFRSPRVLVNAHRCPEPPYAAGPLAAKGGATSMIDVSDGLIADARHLAEASSVVLSISSTAIEVPEEIRATAAAYNVDPRLWLLTGGEDHALLATFGGRRKLPAGFVEIGVVEESGDDGPGVVIDGVRDTSRGGHRHF